MQNHDYAKICLISIGHIVIIIPYALFSGSFQRIERLPHRAFLNFFLNMLYAKNTALMCIDKDS